MLATAGGRTAKRSFGLGPAAFPARLGSISAHLRPLCSTATAAGPGKGHPLLAALEPGDQVRVVRGCAVSASSAELPS